MSRHGKVAAGARTSKAKRARHATATERLEARRLMSAAVITGQVPYEVLNLSSSDIDVIPVPVRVYVDVNKDNKFDAGDLSSTAAFGTITGVPVGTYNLLQVTPADYVQVYAGFTTTATGGVSITVASDGSVTPLGRIDFGDSPTGSISGTVYTDSNANGKPDAGETGLAGVSVFLDSNNDGLPNPVRHRARATAFCVS